MVVEDDGNTLAKVQPVLLPYTKKDAQALEVSFDEGLLKCGKFRQKCTISKNKMNTIKKSPDANSFIYVDVGKWGEYQGVCEYSFCLVSGRDVFLCEYAPWKPDSSDEVRNPYVKAFIEEMKKERKDERGKDERGDGIKVISYAQAPRVAPETVTDSHLYIFIPDLHLPPSSMYVPIEVVDYDAHPDTWPNTPEGKKFEAIVDWTLTPSGEKPWINWIRSTPIYNESSSTQKRYYEIASAIGKGCKIGDSEYYIDRCGEDHYQKKRDIFGNAGVKLVRFLRYLCEMPDDIRKSLHIITLGDMLELWLNRKDYQFTPNEDFKQMPLFISGGEKNAIEYAFEVIVFNYDIFETFRKLKESGIAEVRHCWGNHDNYLMYNSVCDACGIKDGFSQGSKGCGRDSEYKGLNGDILAEHGHRFDSANFDNVEGRGWTKFWKGPYITYKVYDSKLDIRSLEPNWEKFKSFFGHDQREAYLRAYSIMFLDKKISNKEKPFRVFIMGHTHERMMMRTNIRLEYSPVGDDVTVG
jgi:UDP-2,3-diacylglucosamine pyrophosphatase LpxH